MKQENLETKKLRCRRCGGLLGEAWNLEHDNPGWQKIRTCTKCGYNWARAKWKLLNKGKLGCCMCDKDAKWMVITERLPGVKIDDDMEKRNGRQSYYCCSCLCNLFQ